MASELTPNERIILENMRAGHKDPHWGTYGEVTRAGSRRALARLHDRGLVRVNTDHSRHRWEMTTNGRRALTATEQRR